MIQSYLLEAAIVLSFIYEYHKRKKVHLRNIADLKNGILPVDPVLKKDLLGIILLSFVTLLYFAFLVYTTFFFPTKIHPLFLLAPYGIAVTMAILGRRDYLLYQQQRKEQK